MKATIKKVSYIKEYETKFGKMHLFKVLFDDKEAFYSSKQKEQATFKEGAESEFTVTESEKNGKIFLNIKPILQPRYTKEIKKEQSKYSGFAVSYAKDLCIAGKIDFKELQDYATVLFNLMVELDKSISND